MYDICRGCSGSAVMETEDGNYQKIQSSSEKIRSDIKQTEININIKLLIHFKNTCPVQGTYLTGKVTSLMSENNDREQGGVDEYSMCLQSESSNCPQILKESTDTKESNKTVSEEFVLNVNCVWRI